MSERDFTSSPTGFHLREYTATELARALRAAGFARTQAIVSAGGRRLPVLLPMTPVAVVEWMIGLLPRRVRLRVARGLAAVKVVATK